MKTTLFTLLACTLLAALPASAGTVLYDSAGFESFLPAQHLDGQDAPPVGAGPWAQDDGTSSAEVTAANSIEGNQSVKITRGAGPAGDTRWGVVTPATPSATDNAIDVHFDMRVQRKANEFGPLFGVETYDASSGTPKLIGSLLLDASTGELLCHQAGTGAFFGTGTYIDVIPHHHYRLTLNFTEKTCALYADDKLVHTEGFVDPTAASFTDAPLVTLAADPGNNDAGIAYFDNVLIEQTTSALPYLLWQGDSTANTWTTGGPANWHDGISAVAYAGGTPVRFDDTGSTSPSIDVQGTVLPASIEVAADHDYTFAGAGSIAGTTDLVKHGGGTLTLSNPNTYSGETRILEGDVAIRNTSGSATGSGQLTVFPRSTVSGNGSIAGALWVASGGIVAPGVTGPGTLSVGGQLVLDDSVLKFDLGAGSDQIIAGGDVTLGGTLEVADAGGFGPGAYPIITYGGELTFGTLQLASAPDGYAYTIDTTTQGVVALVVTSPPPAPAAPANLLATADGTNTIDLEWSDLSDNEESFVIERALGNGAFNVIASTAADQSAFSDGGLASGTTYAYRVRATNAGGDSPYSNTASARTDLSPAVAHYEYELNTLDSSGNNQHAAPVGTILYAEGHVGEYSATFDGTAFAEIQRVVEANFSVAMWVKTTSNASGGAWYNGMGLVDGEMVGGAADWGCSVLNSKFAFGVGAPDTTILSSRSINDGAWHHVAATRDNNTGTVRLYVDGILDTTADAPTGARTAPAQLRIGATQSNPPKFFVGAMDDLRFYDAVLTGAEVAELGGVPGPPPPPAGDRLTIHPLGDSITWGYTTASAADSPGGYREPLYRNLLTNGVEAVEFVGANTSNPGPLLTRDGQIGHDGYPQYTITEIDNNLDANAPTGKTRGNNGGFWLTGGGVRPALDPEIILLLAGTNDIETGADAPLIESRMSAMVGKIFSLRPNTTLFLASIPPYPADAAKTATAAAYNQLLVDRTVPKYLAAGYDIRFVDQYPNFVLSSGPDGDVVNTALYGDTIHPNEAGYQLMGDTWAGAILAAPQPAPAAPADLVSVEVTAAGITLSWSDQSSDEGAFLIQRSLDGLNFETIGYTGPDATSYTDTQVGGGRTYGYRIVARNSGGDSAASNYLTVTALASPLVAHLKFDETSGTTASDSSPNANDGTVVGDPLWGPGKIANALGFDGTDDHLTLPTGIVENLADFTVASWVKLDSLDNWSRVFDFGTGITNYMFLSPRSGSTGKIRFAMITENSGGEQGVDGSVAMPTGEWTHVAVTLSGSTATLYLNGTAIGSNPTMDLTPASLGATTQNYIGKSQWNDPYLDGAVDDFQIHDRALGQDEISSLYQLTNPVAIPSSPTGLAAVTADGQVDLSWDAVDGAASYSVYRSDGSGYVLVAADLTDAAYTDAGLANGTTYSYAVTASNAGGESDLSDPLDATPFPDAEYGGFAAVAILSAAGSDYPVAQAGPLPEEGGSDHASTLAVDEAGILTGESGHASTIGQAGATRSEASAGDLRIELAGIVVEADFAMARASASYLPDGTTALAASSEIGNLTVAGLPVTITGEPNQLVSLAGAELVIDEQIATGDSITVHALRLTLATGEQVIVAAAYARYLSLTPEPPAPTGDDRLTGGGWIAAGNGLKNNFGIAAGYKNAGLSGHLTYHDKNTAMKVKATAITAYLTGAGPNSRRIEGTAKIDNVDGFTFVIDASDNGEPGRDDTFSITLSNGYSASGTLGGGNIQLHAPSE